MCQWAKGDLVPRLYDTRRHRPEGQEASYMGCPGALLRRELVGAVCRWLLPLLSGGREAIPG